MRPLKMSWLTALEATKSWLSAVLIEAAKIAHKKRPAIKAGYIFIIVTLKTVSAAPPDKTFGSK